MVKRNNDVRFRRGGGSIRNRSTGHQVNFYEHEGVYFLKLKVSAPDSINGLIDEKPVDFHRQGR